MLTSCSATGPDGLARRARGDDQARVALMQGEDGLAISGEEHEIGLPIAGAAAPGDLGRAFGDGEAVLDEAGRAAALAAAKAAPALAARQEVAPAIVLAAGDLGMDEAVDALVADHRPAGLARQAPGDLFG